MRGYAGHKDTWTYGAEYPPQEASQCQTSYKLYVRTACTCTTEQTQHGIQGCSLKLGMMRKKITCCSHCCQHLLKACEDGVNFLIGYCVAKLERRRSGKESDKNLVLTGSLVRGAYSKLQMVGIL